MSTPNLLRSLVLLLATLHICGAIAPQLPPEFVVERHRGWRWASPEGRVSVPPELAAFIDRRLQSMRNRLENTGPTDPLVVHAPDRRSFERVIARLGGAPPKEWVVAVAFASQEVMVLNEQRLRLGPLDQYGRTVAHEIAHLVLGAGRKGIPRWYHEGLAMWLSGDFLDPLWRNDLASLARREALVPLAQLDRVFSKTHRLDNLLYRQSFSFVSHLATRHGEKVHARIIRHLSRNLSFLEAFERSTGERLELAEEAWHDALREEYSYFWRIYGIGLFPALGLVVIVAFIGERRRRRRILRRMAREEMAEEARQFPPRSSSE